MKLPLFHVSYPVTDLAAARSFYVEVLGGRIGRVRAGWCDVFVFGCQLTLHEAPDAVAADVRRHIGVTLAWAQWEELVGRARAAGTTFVGGDRSPSVDYAGTPREQGKVMLLDPSGNAVELKAYRDPDAAFRN